MRKEEIKMFIGKNSSTVRPKIMVSLLVTSIFQSRYIAKNIFNQISHEFCLHSNLYPRVMTALANIAPFEFQGRFIRRFINFLINRSVWEKKKSLSQAAIRHVMKKKGSSFSFFKQRPRSIGRRPLSHFSYFLSILSLIFIRASLEKCKCTRGSCGVLHRELIIISRNARSSLDF